MKSMTVLSRSRLSVPSRNQEPFLRMAPAGHGGGHSGGHSGGSHSGGGHSGGYSSAPTSNRQTQLLRQRSTKVEFDTPGSQA